MGHLVVEAGRDPKTPVFGVEHRAPWQGARSAVRRQRLRRCSRCDRLDGAPNPVATGRLHPTSEASLGPCPLRQSATSSRVFHRHVSVTRRRSGTALGLSPCRPVRSEHTTPHIPGFPEDLSVLRITRWHYQRSREAVVRIAWCSVPTARCGHVGEAGWFPSSGEHVGCGEPDRDVRSEPRGSRDASLGSCARPPPASRGALCSSWRPVRGPGAQRARCGWCRSWSCSSDPDGPGRPTLRSARTARGQSQPSNEMQGANVFVDDPRLQVC